MKYVDEKKNKNQEKKKRNFRERLTSRRPGDYQSCCLSREKRGQEDNCKEVLRIEWSRGQVIKKRKEEKRRWNWKSTVDGGQEEKSHKGCSKAKEKSLIKDQAG